MGVGYTLVNIDKKEKIGFCNVDTGNKLRELSGTVVASAIVTYYLLTNRGNRILFVSDVEDTAKAGSEDYEISSFREFVDVTNRIVDELIEQEILQDLGIKCIDEEDNLFYRNLVNIWDPKVKGQHSS